MTDSISDITDSEQLQQIVTGFAGPFASWVVHAPTRILFDAGEGVASVLQDRVFLPEAVCLTHDHLDHINGLASFLVARTTMRGD